MCPATGGVDDGPGKWDKWRVQTREGARSNGVRVKGLKGVTNGE